MAGLSETDLVNAALRKVSGSRITSMTDGTKNANAASDVYEITRDELLGIHNWNFAKKRAKLARLSTAPTFEYDYAYGLPADWIKTISVHDNDGGTGTVDHSEEEVDGQGVICASVENVYISYVYQLTDPNRMSASFRKALISALARELALPVANSNTVHDKYEREAERRLLKAQSVDAQGSTAQRRPPGSWVTSRRSWRTRTDSFRT
jgi:hypothetical protein